jgi:hypothetical protein
VVEARGFHVVKKPGEPFYHSSLPPHRLEGIEFFEPDNDEWDDDTDFDETFFVDQRCNAFGISYDGYDTDCEDCMNAALCESKSVILDGDITSKLIEGGHKKRIMIEKVPSWKDNRGISILGRGDKGKVIYDNYHRCKVCNGAIRVVLFEKGDFAWTYRRKPNQGTELEVIGKELICPHCEVGKFVVENENT